MKRLYCEFFIGVAVLFFLSIVSYIYVTEELTPDYEEIIEFNQVHSVVNILDDVANSVGQSRADELLAQYAEENRLRVSVYQWGGEPGTNG